MKTTLKNVLGMMLVLFVLASCQEKTKEEKPEPAQQEETEVSAPKQIISLAEADSLYVNYTSRRANSIARMEMQDQSQDEAFVPTRFVSFDLEVVKNYIAYVEQQAKKGGTTVDSLRIYLGNYGINGKDPKKNTVFILPAAKVDGDFGGIYIGDDGTAKLMRNYFNGGQEGEPKSEASFLPSLNANLLQGGSSLVMNVGNGGPPPNGDF